MLCPSTCFENQMSEIMFGHLQFSNFSKCRKFWENRSNTQNQELISFVRCVPIFSIFSFVCGFFIFQLPTAMNSSAVPIVSVCFSDFYGGFCNSPRFPRKKQLRFPKKNRSCAENSGNMKMCKKLVKIRGKNGNESGKSRKPWKF